MPNSLNLAINYLTESRCSEKELRLYLEKTLTVLENKQEKIDSIINYLKESELLNDFRLAEHLASHYVHKGNRFIKRLLKSRMIDAAVIEQIFMTMDDERTRALEVARSKIRSSAILNRKEMEDMLIRFLNGRHFSDETSEYVVKKLTASSKTRQLNGLKNNVYRPVFKVVA